jgi:hypothetical protein
MKDGAAGTNRTRTLLEFPQSRHAEKYDSSGRWLTLSGQGGIILAALIHSFIFLAGTTALRYGRLALIAALAATRFTRIQDLNHSGGSPCNRLSDGERGTCARPCVNQAPGGKTKEQA